MARGSSAARNTERGEAGEEKVNGGAAPAQKFQRPAGYQQAASDVDQFWTQEGPIHGKLRGAKEYVNKLQSDSGHKRLNKIYVFELVEDCKTESSKGEAFEKPAKRGELVGVWGSPGMRQLNALQDCIVWMAPAGTKDVGKPKPMKVYDIVFKGTEKPIVIIGSQVGAGESRSAQQAASESDEIPF